MQFVPVPTKLLIKLVLLKAVLCTLVCTALRVYLENARIHYPGARCCEMIHLCAKRPLNVQMGGQSPKTHPSPQFLKNSALLETINSDCKIKCAAVLDYAKDMAFTELWRRNCLY